MVPPSGVVWPSPHCVDKSRYCCIITKTINDQERHFIIVSDVNISQDITMLNTSGVDITFAGVFSWFEFCKYFKEWWIFL